MCYLIGCGFSYACPNHLIELLELFGGEFVFLQDRKTFQPIVQLVSFKDNKREEGNIALYLSYGMAKEVRVAIADWRKYQKKKLYCFYT